MMMLDKFGRPVEVEEEELEEVEPEEEESPFAEVVSEMDELDRFFLSESDWLDGDYMDALWERDPDKYSELESKLQDVYGFSAPLKRNAPRDVIEKYNRHGELNRILHENGIEI